MTSYRQPSHRSLQTHPHKSYIAPHSQSHAAPRLFAQFEIFKATPSGKALSPILTAVVNFSNSQDDTFSVETASLGEASVFWVAAGDLITYLTLLPSMSVTERTKSFTS